MKIMEIGYSQAKLRCKILFNYELLLISYNLSSILNVFS